MRSVRRPASVRRAALLAAACAALCALAAAPAAWARTYEVKAALAGTLERVAKRTVVPVRLPARLSLDFDGRLHGHGTASARGFRLTLDGTVDCRGADVCSLASFTGRRGGWPATRRAVRLARGITGYYRPSRCAASCSPPLIQWRQGGVLYGIEAKLAVAGASAQRDAMVRAANAAITARAL